MGVAAIRQLLYRRARRNVQECQLSRSRADVPQNLVEAGGFDVLQHIGADYKICDLRLSIFARNGRIVFANVNVGQRRGEVTFAAAVVQDRATSGSPYKLKYPRGPLRA